MKTKPHVTGVDRLPDRPEDGGWVLQVVVRLQAEPEYALSSALCAVRLLEILQCRRHVCQPLTAGRHEEHGKRIVGIGQQLQL